MSKYYEYGKWLFEYHRSDVAHEVIIHFEQRLLLWISKRKLLRRFELTILNKTISVKY